MKETIQDEEELEKQFKIILNKIESIMDKLKSEYIFHGDIHTNNVMFDQNDNLKLIDFSESSEIAEDDIDDVNIEKDTLLNKAKDIMYGDFDESDDEGMDADVDEYDEEKNN